MVGESVVRSFGDGLELGQAKPICVANANQKTFGFKRDEGLTWAPFTQGSAAGCAGWSRAHIVALETNTLSSQASTQCYQQEKQHAA